MCPLKVRQIRLNSRLNRWGVNPSPLVVFAVFFRPIYLLNLQKRTPPIYNLVMMVGKLWYLYLCLSNAGPTTTHASCMVLGPTFPLSNKRTSREVLLEYNLSSLPRLFLTERKSGEDFNRSALKDRLYKM